MRTIFGFILLFIITMLNFSLAGEGAECLAIAMLREAGNQPAVGRQAVGLVILNRAEQRNKSVCAVIRERKQFSWYKGGKLSKYIRKDSRIHAIRFEAMDLINKPKKSKAYAKARLRKATYFHATYVKPKWARSMCQPIRIRDHIFYSECTA